MNSNQTKEDTMNPYQSPNTNNSIVNSFVSEQEASRSSRLGAALIDGLIGIFIMLPLVYFTVGFGVFTSSKQLPLTTQLMFMAVGVVAYFLIHGFFLKEYGQTVGKRLLGIYIANNDTGEVVEFKTFVIKRYLPIAAVGSIPFIGTILTMIDILFIFRADKRCVHDLIANTKVMKEQA